MPPGAKWNDTHGILYLENVSLWPNLDEWLLGLSFSSSSTRTKAFTESHSTQTCTYTALYPYILTYQGAQESWNKWWAPCRHHHAAMTGHSNSTDPQGRADTIWMPLAHMKWANTEASTHNHSISSAISALVQALPGNHTRSIMSPIYVFPIVLSHCTCMVYTYATPFCSNKHAIGVQNDHGTTVL